MCWRRYPRAGMSAAGATARVTWIETWIGDRFVPNRLSAMLSPTMLTGTILLGPHTKRVTGVVPGGAGCMRSSIADSTGYTPVEAAWALPCSSASVASRVSVNAIVSSGLPVAGPGGPEGIPGGLGAMVRQSVSGLYGKTMIFGAAVGVSYRTSAPLRIRGDPGKPGMGNAAAARRPV